MTAPASEHLLCADFSTAATAQGWTVYPETAGFDLLLTKDGLQLGIEAKLRPSMELLNQVAAHLDPHGYRTKGPHYVAALVPAYRGQWHSITQALGIAVIAPQTVRRAGQWPSLDALIECLPPLHFSEPAWLPPVVPDVPAGGFWPGSRSGATSLRPGFLQAGLVRRALALAGLAVVDLAVRIAVPRDARGRRGRSRVLRGRLAGALVIAHRVLPWWRGIARHSRGQQDSCHGT